MNLKKREREMIKTVVTTLPRMILLLVAATVMAVTAVAGASFDISGAHAQSNDKSRSANDENGSTEYASTEGLSAEMVPGQFIVKFKPNTHTNERQQVIRAQGGGIFDRNTELDVEAVEFPALKEKPNDRAIEALLTALRRNPNIEYAEPNYIRTATYVPNDPKVADQWALDRIDAYEAWDEGRGSLSTTIAIVDTGMNTAHEDLNPPFSFRIKSPMDLIDNDTSPDDVYKHGTQVAGVAAAVMDNGKGGAGLCPGCSLMPVKVANNLNFNDFVAGKGITDAAEAGAKVINVSLGGYYPSEYFERAVDHAWNKGAFLTCAAGNDNRTDPFYPAAYDRCFAVASTDKYDTRSSFSNHGSWVDVAAPGNGVLTTRPEHYSDSLGWYELVSGTSFAAPYVAGLAGLLASGGNDNYEIRGRICRTADDIVGTGTDWSCGRINADRADVHIGVKRIALTVPETTIESGPDGSTNDSTPTFTFSGSDDVTQTADMRYSYRIDDGEWSEYSSDTSVTLGGTNGLSDREYTFEVRTKDGADNADQSPAQQSFTVDTAAPSAPETTSPANNSYDTDGVIDVSGTAEMGSTVELQDGTSPVGSATADSSSGAWSVTTSTLTDGSHSLTATATDAAGNTSRASSALNVSIDTKAPSITITTPADGAYYTLDQAVYADYSCEEESGGSGVDSCAGTLSDGAMLDTSTLGTKTFKVDAKDKAGNTASKEYTYRIVYDFKGYFNPVDNPPTVNVAKAGSAIPVKFSLGGNQGLYIMETGYPKAHKTSCETGASIDTIEETVTSGSSSLSYDSATGQYSYVWKTDKGWAGTCRQLVVKLKDGIEHQAQFMFTR